MADKRVREVVELFTILLATTRAVLQNKSAKATLLGSYDSVGHNLILELRDTGLTAEDLMELERHLASLRLALDEATRAV